MTTTPLWVPLLVAAIGLVGAVGGTIAGVVITQIRADRRETTAFERQQRHERAVWAREDAARTFEHRREAYANFYIALREMTTAIQSHGMGIGDEPAPENGRDMPMGWDLPTFQKLQQVGLYGSALVYAAGKGAYNSACNWGGQTMYGRDDGDFYEGSRAAHEVEKELLRIIREDLSIPDDAIFAPRVDDAVPPPPPPPPPPSPTLGRPPRTSG